MLAKALIQDVINPYTLRVRIPSLNKIDNVNGSTPNNELSMAIVCAPPNIVTNAHSGDVVILGFEDGDVGKPIVLGHLSTHSPKTSMVNIKCDDFSAEGEIKLGEDTTIGDILPENILSLKNQKENIKETFDEISKSFEVVDEKISKLDETSSTNADNISDIQAELFGINNSIIQLGNKIQEVNTRCYNIEQSLIGYLKKNPMVLDSSAYGSDISSIQNPEEGQIYFATEENSWLDILTGNNSDT